MITVLIRVKQGPEALAMTLSALVPAVAAGLVGDAVILAERHDEEIAAVADAAGATIVISPEDSWQGGWQGGARAARRDWILCLDDGDIPQEGWIRVLDRFMGLGTCERHRARLRRRSGVIGAIVEVLRDLLGSSAVRAGDLVHRRVLLREVKALTPVRLPATIERDPAFG